MMQRNHVRTPAGAKAQKEILLGIYALYSQWVDRFPLACSKGCATCCTGSVTMTSLEGRVILDVIKEQGREKWLKNKLAIIPPGKSTAGITTNQFAAACLNHREIDENLFGCWDLSSCVFCENGICSIYAARPFGCRSFGSLVQCSGDREAVVAPIHITINTVLTQVIEHLDSNGGCWSTMTDVLHAMLDSATSEKNIHLLQALPLPGFLLEPTERHVVRDLFRQLEKQFAEIGMFGDLIDNFLLI